MDDSAFAGLVIICVSRYVIIVIDMVFENMRLISGMFWASAFVMSRSSPIASPTFVRGAMDDSKLSTPALETCVPGKGC